MITAYNDKLPQWVREVIPTMCTYCGAHLADNSETGVMTARWCINPKCPGHMQHKMVAVANHFGIKGFGEKTALSYIKTHNCESHLEILNEFFTEKPMVRLSAVAKLAFIEGLGETTASKELDAYSSFENYFRTVPIPNETLWINAEYLYKCEKYFRIAPPLAKEQVLVMGTGSFHGFNNRDEYFAELNRIFGQYIRITEAKSARKTGVSYLIKEPDAVDHTKSRIAKEYGIPIVTPREFIDILCNYLHIDMEV